MATSLRIITCDPCRVLVAAAWCCMITSCSEGYEDTHHDPVVLHESNVSVLALNVRTPESLQAVVWLERLLAGVPELIDATIIDDNLTIDSQTRIGEYGRVSAASISSDGSMVAVVVLSPARGNVVSVRSRDEVVAGFDLQIGLADDASSVAISHDNTRIAIGDLSGNVWCIDVDQQTIVEEWMIGTDVRSLAWRDGSTQVVAVASDALYMLEGGDRPRNSIPIKSSLGQLTGAMQIVDNHVYIGTQNGYILAIADDVVRKVGQINAQVNVIAHHSGRLYVGDDLGDIHRASISTGTIETIYNGSVAITKLAIDEAGTITWVQSNTWPTQSTDDHISAIGQLR